MLPVQYGCFIHQSKRQTAFRVILTSLIWALLGVEFQMSQTTLSRFASSQRNGLIGTRGAKSTCLPLSKRLLINDESRQHTAINLSDRWTVTAPHLSGSHLWRSRNLPEGGIHENNSVTLYWSLQGLLNDFLWGSLSSASNCITACLKGILQDKWFPARSLKRIFYLLFFIFLALPISLQPIKYCTH